VGDLCLAVDIGGTKMAAGLVDDSGEVIHRAHVATAGAADGEALFATLAELVDGVRAVAPREPVVCGVGCGGPMVGGGRAVSPIYIEVWRGFPLHDRLSAHTGLPTFVDNDAKALALGEGWVGRAVGHRDYLAMVVSTGVGGGIVLDGRLLDGDDGNAGHIGHVIVEPDGRICGCGARGCLEAQASGLAIEAMTGRPPAEAPPELVDQVGRWVGRAVASVCALLDLRLALVAGSVALGYGDAFFAAAQAELAARARISFAADAVVRPAGLGSEGPLIGAAAVARRATAPPI
jgi:glucokinase